MGVKMIWLERRYPESNPLDISESFMRGFTCALSGTDRKIKELQSDNKELRKLVKSAWRCTHTGISCSDCRLIAGGCTLQSAMRELGIEEDE